MQLPDKISGKEWQKLENFEGELAKGAVFHILRRYSTFRITKNQRK